MVPTVYLPVSEPPKHAWTHLFHMLKNWVFNLGFFMMFFLVTIVNKLHVKKAYDEMSNDFKITTKCLIIYTLSEKYNSSYC